MRFWAVFRKTWRELSRDWLVLSLTVAFSPFFVLLYWLFTSGGSTSYTVLVVNQDRGAQTAQGAMLQAGEQVFEAIQSVRYADGSPLLKAAWVESVDEAGRILRDRGAVAYLLIPEDFSASLLELQSGEPSASTRIVFGGDLTNPYYMVGATLALTAAESAVVEVSGHTPLIQYLEQPLGASAARTEFEVYTPGILIFAVIMLIFPAAMQAAREVESGALRRLALTPMRAFDFLGGISAVLVLVGVASVLLTFATALALGFRSQGPLWVAVLVGAVTSLSVIGMGMIVACFSRSVSQAFVIANFPLGLLMFFSGAIFPIPKPALFYVGERPISLYDLLPPTHGVVALNKILTLGAGLDEVLYELCALTLLSLLYFAAGAWLFQRMHLRR